MRFAAFISYSHAGDTPVAAALQASLQCFAKPWYARRALNVFRDQTNLGASPKLWRAIEAALGQSEWFILMASPESARSSWVQKELMTTIAATTRPLRAALVGCERELTTLNGHPAGGSNFLDADDG